MEIEEAVQELRAIGKAHGWRGYLRSKERKRKTAAIWEHFSSPKRLLIVKKAYEN